jgi:hypothetical protein
MKLQLLIDSQLPECLETRTIWQQACQQLGISLEIIEMEDEIGKQLIDDLSLKSFPVLIADGKVKAVGRPKARDAVAILQQLLIS